MNIIQAQQYYSVDDYIARHEQFMGGLQQTLLRLKSEGHITRAKTHDNSYYDHSKHTIKLTVETNKRQVEISLKFEPIFIWFIEPPVWKEQLATYLKMIYDKVKNNMDDKIIVEISRN